MNKTTKIGIDLVKASLILGISGNLLLRSFPFGLNVALWTALLVVGMIAVTRRAGAAGWNAHRFWLFGALIFFGGMFALFDSPQLLFLDGIAIGIVLVALVVPVFVSDVTRAGVFHYASAAFTSGVSAAFGPIAVVADDINWKSVPKNGISRYLIPIARGLALTVPVTLVIGGLLMAADASFQSFVEKTIRIDPDEIVAHFAISSAIAWGVLGYFRATVFGVGLPQTPRPATGKSVSAPRFSITEHTTEDPDKEKTDKTRARSEDSGQGPGRKSDLFPEWLRLGLIETTIVLGSVNLLFAGFLIFQLPYLFGGMDLVQQTPDFKLAEYARRGVTELIAVSILVLPMLLSMHWLLKKEQPAAEKVFRVLSTVQIALLFVIMISATQRLSLLTGSLGYGQTTFRFYAYFFLIWMALVFVWFGMTVLRGLRKQFAYGALWSALFIIAMLHYVNPDDYIVRSNVDLMMQGRAFDSAYNAGLSADATPALLESLDKMSGEDRETVVETLGYKGCHADPESDIRNWNWSRSISNSLISKARTGGESLCR